MYAYVWIVDLAIKSLAKHKGYIYTKERGVAEIQDQAAFLWRKG